MRGSGFWQDLHGQIGKNITIYFGVSIKSSEGPHFVSGILEDLRDDTCILHDSTRRICVPLSSILYFETEEK